MCCMQEEVLTHWGSRPNFFTRNVTTMEGLSSQVDKSHSAKKVADVVALFHFEKLRMVDDDEEKPEAWEVVGWVGWGVEGWGGVG